MPDPPNLMDYNRSGSRIDGPSYTSSNPPSTYSTLKDSSYRSYSSATSPYTSNNNYGTIKNSENMDFIDDDIPYHARQTSQPFSYGATNDMIKHQKLSSPSLVRKATMRGHTSPIIDLLEPNTPDPPPEFANGLVKANVDTTDRYLMYYN